MGLKDLEKLLTENGDSKSEQIKIDWDAEKHKWLEAVRDFYNDVESWVGKLPNLKIEYKVHTITEENIGRYEINKMITVIGSPYHTVISQGKTKIKKKIIKEYFNNFYNILPKYEVMEDRITTTFNILRLLVDIKSKPFHHS